MISTEGHHYPHFRRYDINEESYHQRFKGAKKKEGETNRKLAARLEDLVDKWMQDWDKIETIKDLVVLEQLVETLPTDVRIFVKEQKPTTTAEAAKLTMTTAKQENKKKSDLKGKIFGNRMRNGEPTPVHDVKDRDTEPKIVRLCCPVLQVQIQNSTVLQNRVHNKGEENALIVDKRVTTRQLPTKSIILHGHGRTHKSRRE